MVNKQKIVKSGLWQLMNTAIIFMSQLGYYAIMARLIDNAKAAFGVLALLNACLNFGNVVAEAGMGDALLQRKIVEPGHKNAALYYSILTAIFFYIILFFLAPTLARIFRSADTHIWITIDWAQLYPVFTGIAIHQPAAKRISV